MTRAYAGVTSAAGGGIGIRYASFARELAREGHEVHVLARADEDEQVVEQGGVHIHLLGQVTPDRLWYLADLPAARAVRRALSRLEHFDVIVAPEWGGGAAAYSRRKDRGPLVTNLTTSLEQMVAISPGWKRSIGERAGNRIQAGLERGQAERSDAIVACSRAILDWAQELWQLDGLPHVVLPNFIDVPRARALADGPPPAGFPADGPVVLFSGRLEIRKGAHVLAEAMPHVWRKHPDARLVTVGGDWQGGMSALLRERAGDFADRLHFLGDQPPEQVFPAVAAADVVALPSLWEAFGLVALEAMALARPCVLTSGSGFEEFFVDGEHGAMVAPGDARELGDALARLLDDRELRERAGRAAAATAERFSVEVVTPRYVDWFSTVAGKG